MLHFINIVLDINPLFNPPINSRVLRSRCLLENIHQPEALILDHIIFLCYFFNQSEALELSLV